MTQRNGIVQVEPGSFEPERHFYPRVLNAQIHPMIRHFTNLGNERIAERYAHLHPQVEAEKVLAVLSQRPNYFHWAGADLFCTTTNEGVRRVVVIEVNSCPSGQKSMPLLDESDEQAGYRNLITNSFVPLLKRLKRKLPPGRLAVVYDKNKMEASGYAACMADALGEPVLLVTCHEADPSLIRFTETGLMQVYFEEEWHPIRAAFRYVTQKPWDRIPPLTRTLIYNPIICCLAGGRNKMLASKAYDLYNAGSPEDLMIRTPDTMWNVKLEEVPLWVQSMGGIAVVKNPYSNAGQGVYTITTQKELDDFLALEHTYNSFIVQALIGNNDWSSRGAQGSLYHIGTVPDKKGRIFVADLRFMIGAGPNGFFPVAVYARRTRKPLDTSVGNGNSSWDMLGTNLSIKQEDGSWTTDTDRLLLMDSRDFNKLGIGLDDLIEGYIQTVLSTLAIDSMAKTLTTTKGRLHKRLFRSLNPDKILSAEICE